MVFETRLAELEGMKFGHAGLAIGQKWRVSLWAERHAKLIHIRYRYLSKALWDPLSASGSFSSSCEPCGSKVHAENFCAMTEQWSFTIVHPWSYISFSQLHSLPWLGVYPVQPRHWIVLAPFGSVEQLVPQAMEVAFKALSESFETHEQWSFHRGWLFYIGDYATQLYGDYSKPLQGSLWTNQQHGMS